MRKCYEYSKFLDKKNDANNSLELFGSSLYRPDVAASRENVHLGPSYFSNELIKLKDLKQYIQKKTLDCKDDNPDWNKNEIVMEVNSKIEVAITNLKAYLNAKREASTGKVVNARGGKKLRTRKFRCRTNVCKSNKNKRRTKRNRTRKRNKKLRSSKRKRGGGKSIHKYLRDRESGSRGIAKKVSLPFMLKSDGTQPRINQVVKDPKLHSQIPSIKDVTAAVRKRPKQK